MTILELREKRAKAWDAAKAFLDSHRTDKGTLSAEERSAEAATDEAEERAPESERATAGTSAKN